MADLISLRDCNFLMEESMNCKKEEDDDEERRERGVVQGTGSIRVGSALNRSKPKPV